MYRLLTKALIVGEILLFLGLPFIPAHARAKSKSVVIPSVMLKEDNLANIAQFKSYQDTDDVVTFEVNVSKNESKEPAPTQAQITPAVQSVAYVKHDTPTPQPVDLAASPQSLTSEQITYLGNCEAGMDPTKNTGNGYYGAFQFSYGTWQSMNTGYERADLAPLEVQIDAVQRLLQRSSIYTQFPACARNMQTQGII